MAATARTASAQPSDPAPAHDGPPAPGGATVERLPVDAPAPAPARTLVTFDVFETVLVRAVSPAAAVFDVVGEAARAEGLVSCSAQAFSRAREWADRRAVRRHGDGATLAHIHAELAAALGLDAATADRLAALEVAMEAELLQPVPSVLPLLAAERASVGRVVYVSDMYLPADVIQGFLARHGLWEEDDVLYVSHAHGRSKRRGTLFDLVASTEGVPVGGIRHHGNDDRTDVRGALRAGATPVLLPDGNPNRYERLLQRHRHATDGVTAAMAGAARLARVSSGAVTEHERALADVASGVMAPVLVSYVQWLLRRAEALGLERLYFVARDGQVLLRVAERLAPRLGSTVELRYLHASRLVWNRAVSGPNRNPQVWHSLIHLSSDGVPNRDLLERTGLGAEAVEAAIAASGDPAAWASTDRAVLVATLDRLEADGTLGTAAAESRRVVLRYLREQGLLDGGRHGFVDVGWRGTQHDVLAELQAGEGVPPAVGLFFGLDRSTSPWGDLREAWFFDSRDDGPADPGDLLPLGGEYLPSTSGRAGVPIGLAQFALVEVFCSGDHGTVTDYEETPDGVRPVLTEGRREATTRWGLPLVWRTLDAYVDHLVPSALAARHVDVHQALADVMRAFWEWPTRAEALAWSSFPWEVGQGRAQRVVPLARPLRMSGLARDVVGGRPSPGRLKAAVRRAQRTEWVAASVLLSAPPAALALRPRSAVRQASTRGKERLRTEVRQRRRRLGILLGR